MTREALWQEIVRQNPAFAGTMPVMLDPRGVRKLFDLAFDKGYEHGEIQLVGELGAIFRHVTPTHN